MSDSEIFNTFDKNRDEFKPYGLTCEIWKPDLMPRSDRHNEIELNYFPEGSTTYLFQDCKVTVPTGKLTIFWALIPHQIIQYESNLPYYVCTIPLSQFLEWKLPASFVDKILEGNVLMEASDEFSLYDEFLLKNWIKDINSGNKIEAIILEMHARLIRMATGIPPEKDDSYFSIYSNNVSIVEQIAICIARNYRTPLKVSDIGKAVGLHPDYANNVFKKAFGCTISDYLIKERIAHAQRVLVSTDKSITDIAFDSGFNSISRFNAAFLNKIGCTPREFRKRKEIIV